MIKEADSASSTKITRKKVLVITEDMDNGGTYNVLKNIAINQKRYEHVFVCLEQKYKDKEIEGMKVYELRKRLGIWKYLPFKIIKLAYEASKIIRKEKPYIMHMHTPGAVCRGMLASLLFDVPVKIYTHHNLVNIVKLKEYFELRFLLRKMDKIIAVADKAKGIIADRLRINPSKIEVIINGIDPEKFSKKTDAHKIRKSIGLYDKDKIVSIVSELREEKDHITLIRAFSKVAEKEKDAKLLIIGPGKNDIAEQIREEIRKNGLENKVIMLGEREDVPDLLNITDVSVLSSTSEATSMFLLESMASSKAIVATDVGGNPEIVEDNVNGLLVKPRNPSEMADAIIKLLGDKKLRDRMGKEGRKKVEEYLNAKRMASEYEKLYDKLILEKERKHICKTASSSDKHDNSV